MPYVSSPQFAARHRYRHSHEPSEVVRVDCLIIGSGPVGATYARRLALEAPSKQILMVDLGNHLSKRVGINQKNFYVFNSTEDGLNALSNVVKGQLTYTSAPVEQPWPETLEPISQPLHPNVVYPINSENPDQSDVDNMPSGASSFNVGGMGAHWTCCTPRPTGPEKIDFIPEMEELLSEAEKIVHTTQNAFDESLRGIVVHRRLAEAFDAKLPEGRKVQMLPLACQRTSPTWVEWTGVDTVLGPLAEDDFPRERFTLASETICRGLTVEGGRVRRAHLEHLVTGRRYDVEADVFVVAANAFYTPQLLWASHIRPPALGRFLNDQPMLFCQIVLRHELLHEIAGMWNPPPPDVDPVPIPMDDPIPNVWIPYSADAHPFHCQIHRDAFPYSVVADDIGIDHRTIIDLRWFLPKEIRWKDHMTFSDKYTDLYGMPQITFHYELSETDGVNLHRAFVDMERAAGTLGGYLAGSPPQVLPRGSSLHYQGTYRMTPHNDPATGVCDSHSRVWDIENLYLGGNGIIPTSTACNPTLTSIALALRASDHILKQWGGS